MEINQHTLEALFAQLGLDNDPKSIEEFVIANKPLPKNQALHQATFWNKSQQSLLQEAITEDSEWAIAADQLDSLLRNNKHNQLFTKLSDNIRKVFNL